jgi:hypothetical protein
MADFRGDYYLFQGLNSLGSQIGNALEKKKEEAQLIKSIKSYAKASGLASPEDIELADPYALKGFVEGAMAKKHLEQQDAATGMRNMDAMRKFASDQNMAGFAGEFNKGLESGDAMSAFKNALKQYPAAAADERFSGFLNAFDKLTPDSAKPSVLEKDINYLQEHFGVSDEDAKKFAIGNMMQRSSGKQTRIRMNPTTGEFEITEGAADDGSAPTAGFRTEAQKNIANYESTIGTIGHIQRNMKSSDFGLMGVVGRFKDKWLEQAVSGSADKRRIDVHAAISQVREDLIKTLKNDSNISIGERAELVQSLPSLGPGESATDAAQKLITAKERIVRKVRSYSEKLGTKPPVWALSPKEIADAWAAKEMTEAEATDALQKYYPDLISQ